MQNTNHSPRVSIITPFLNAEKFIEECIESVLSQTYPNWELLLIDDGSTDRSTIIAKDYAVQYPGRIFYLEHENHQNLGASASRNLGINSSKGEYIAFLDADDIYLPMKLEVQVPLLNAYPEAGMLYASTEYWYSWTGLKEDADKDWIWRHFGVKPDTLVKPPQLLTLFLQDGGTVPCMGSILVRRKAIDAVGGWENTFKYIYTDQVFHAKICLKWPVLVCSGCWDKYRQHPNSSTHLVDRNNEGYGARKNYLTWLEQHLIEQKAYTDQELLKSFKKEIFPIKYPRLKGMLNLPKRILNKVKRELNK